VRLHPGQLRLVVEDEQAGLAAALLELLELLELHPVDLLHQLAEAQLDREPLDAGQLGVGRIGRDEEALALP
jgi:hypothetical protein